MRQTLFTCWNLAMHPIVVHECLRCCILLGYLFASALTFSSWHYGDISGNQLHGHSVSFLGNNEKGGIPTSVKGSMFSSPTNDSVSCEALKGVGSFDTICVLKSSLHLSSDLHIYGKGDLEILPGVLIACPLEGCSLSFNVSGNVKVGEYAAIFAGSVVVSAANMTMGNHSAINTTSLGGPPPSQTSGTPVGYDGAGGGHGGRGASCLKNNQTNFWGGDVYSWSSLSYPWSYGSKGGGTSVEDRFGGNGGGRIMILVKDLLFINGSVTTEGDDGGLKGGGGSGGSIIIHALKLPQKALDFVIAKL